MRELVRPIRLVPETKPVSDLMRQMQQENTHMVIVVDEYGNTAGLATMEDLLEVIIGEIRDEHEPESDVTEDGQGGFIVSGSFDLDRISDLVDTFRREEDIESTTVGGLVSEWLGRVPKAGESRRARRHPHRSAGQRRAARRAGPHQQVANGCSMTELKTEFQVGVRLHHRPAERRKIHAAECPGRARRSPSSPISRRPRGRRSRAWSHCPKRRSFSSIRPASTRADSPLNKRLMDTVRNSLEERDLLRLRGRRRAQVQRTGPARHRRGAAHRHARACWCSTRSTW